MCVFLRYPQQLQPESFPAVINASEHLCAMLSSTDPKVLSSAVTVFDRIVRTMPQGDLDKFASPVRGPPDRRPARPCEPRRLCGMCDDAVATLLRPDLAFHCSSGND